MIYFGFLGLLAVTTVLEIDHQMPEDLKFLHGDVYRGYAAFGDLMGLIFLGGIVWAIGRRYIQRPYRIRIKSKPEHAVILGTFFVIGVSGYGAEMFRIALEDRPSYEQWSFIGYPLSGLVDGWSVSALETWHQWWWIAHVVSFIVFLAILPITMLRHMFTSPINMYLKDKDRPKGAMRPMPNLMETELEIASVPRSSRTSRGSNCSTSTPARCAAAARRCAPRMPPASRSTRVRSCSRPAR